MSHPKPGVPFPCVVHPFASDTPGACAYETGLPSAKNTLLFVGGLGDGPHTIPFVRTLAKRLEGAAPTVSYSVFELRMKSSFSGWGLSDLSRDVKDIECLVQYLRYLGKDKVVLMGHSTGCQVRATSDPSPGPGDTVLVHQLTISGLYEVFRGVGGEQTARENSPLGPASAARRQLT
jgi:Protein of unknown function (DUF1749)